MRPVCPQDDKTQTLCSTVPAACFRRQTCAATCASFCCRYTLCQRRLGPCTSNSHMHEGTLRGSFTALLAASLIQCAAGTSTRSYHRQWHSLLWSNQDFLCVCCKDPAKTAIVCFAGLPVITPYATPNQPSSSANYITINGNNFGAVDQTPSSYVSNGACQTASWTSATAVFCKLGSGTTALGEMSRDKGAVGPSTHCHKLNSLYI